MKQNLILAVCFCLALCCSPAMKTSAQAELFAGLTVEQVSASIRRDLETLLGEAEASASRTMFDARSHLLILMAQLDALASKQQGTLWENLGQAERRFFMQASALTKSGARDAARLLDSAQQIADTFESAVGRVLDDAPRLTRMSPSYAVASPDGTARLRFSGAFLLHDLPSLSLGEASCTLARALDTALEFDCPLPTELTRVTGQFLAGELTVFESKRWWQRVFFRKPDPRLIRTGITLVGSQVGELSLRAHGQRTASIERPREQPFYHRNDHCRGDRPVVETYSPGRGCRIRLDSIRVSENVRSSNSVNNGIRNVTDGGFQWSGVVRNSGRCGPLGVPRDARGALGVTVHWVDVCEEVQTFENEALATRVVQWGDSFMVPVPPGTKDITYELRGGVLGDRAGRSFDAGLIKIEITGGQALISVGAVDAWLADN